MEDIQNISDIVTENLDKNLKQNEMVHIAENIDQEHENNSELNENGQNSENEQQNGENEQQNHENEQQNCKNEHRNGENEQQNHENEQQNCKNEKQNGEIDVENQKCTENEDTLPLEVKIDEDEEFNSYTDGNRVFKKYKFRQKDHKPDYTALPQPPRITFKSRTRYENQDSFDCDQCPQSFNSRYGLLNHIRKHITEKNIKYTCAICSEVFDKNGDLIAHKIVHKDMLFTCEKCQLAFTDHCDFLEHEITHTLRSTYKCMECGKYYNKNSMSAHFQTHFDRRIKCEICQSRVKKNGMKNHMANHKMVKCVECNKMIRPDTMSYHMKSHTGVKKFQCLYCGKGFANGSQRNIHTRVHTNERPFECDICQQKFKQYTDIKKHKLTHFGKQFQCETCHKKFIHKESLVAHTSTHNNTQRFKCEICNLAISTQTGYTSHMIHKHSDDKLFPCRLCDKRFKTKSLLAKHFKSLTHRRNACKKEFEGDD